MLGTLVGHLKAAGGEHAAHRLDSIDNTNYDKLWKSIPSTRDGIDRSLSMLL